MLAMAIPSYKREKWITEQYIENIHKNLITPLGGDICLFLYIQDPDPQYVPTINALQYKYGFDLMYVDPHNMSIAEVRYQAVYECFKRYPKITHVLTADDDMYLINGRAADDYSLLVRTLEPETTYVLYPGPEYTEKDYVHPGCHGHYTPGMLRGQVYPREGFMAVDRGPLKNITVGEDYVLPRVIDRPIKWVTGFNENIHLCDRTIEQRGVLRKWYDWDGKGEARRTWERFKDRYNFADTGYDPCSGRSNFFDFPLWYPEYFTPEGYYKL